MKYYLILLSFLIFVVSCKKEYIINEYYITNEYNEYITRIDSVYIARYYSYILAQQNEITTSILPPYLQAGDSVGIFATSNAVFQQDMQNGIDILKSWGLKVREADNLYDTNGRYAGTLPQRIDGLQNLINDPNLKAIIAARGGYGCDQLLPYVNLKPLQNSPKWVVGYSDVTVLHVALNNLGIQSIHGAMVNFFSDSTSVSELKKALFGEYPEMSIETNENCIQGTAEGRLVGGNLTTFYALGGTFWDLNVKGAILFFEDTGEANYNVNRMLTNLKFSGKLDAVKGIIVGQFTDMTQGIDKPIADVIRDNVGDLGIPVMYGAQTGHGIPNLPLYFGRNVKLNVANDRSTISFE